MESQKYNYCHCAGDGMSPSISLPVGGHTDSFDFRNYFLPIKFTECLLFKVAPFISALLDNYMEDTKTLLLSVNNL